MSHEKPQSPLIGQDSNIFVLMGIASRTLKENGYNDEAKEMINRINTEAKSYDEALCILTKYVEPVSVYEESIFEEDEDLEL